VPIIKDKTMDSLLDWIEISLFVLSIILLIVVYFIIKSQLRAKKLLKITADSYFSLLLTIHPIHFFIKRINGEYLLINKQFCDLFELSNDAIIKKTDYDFLPEDVADTYRNSDIEVVKNYVN
jgi:PAS domain-containing protein